MAGALDWAQDNLDLQAQITALGQALAGQAGNLLAGSVSLVAQLVIMLFVLFFLYRDSEQALRALRLLAPLSDAEASCMGSRIADTIRAMVNGSLTVAFVQALLAGAMYAILGVPAAAIWGCATFIVALVPMFGTFLVWGPISLFLLLSGGWVKALILVAWGGLVVSFIDNLLVPLPGRQRSSACTPCPRSSPSSAASSSSGPPASSWGPSCWPSLSDSSKSGAERTA